MILLSPTGLRRLGSRDGWVLFFYGGHDVLGVVWDVPREDWF